MSKRPDFAASNFPLEDAADRPALLILGTRGIPAAHGGFETFAEHLASHLISKGWRVTVYCQENQAAKNRGPENISIDHWNGVRRVRIAPAFEGPFGTVAFDWLCVRHALREKGVPLVLGYNTAVFTLLLRLAGRPVLMNMDGLEWKRSKWSAPAKAWFYANEWLGALFSTRLIADHPAIANHLASRRSRRDIVMIAYGAEPIADAPVAPVQELGLSPGTYFLAVGRIEPENSILEMVTAFTRRKRECTFVCLGALDPANNPYHAKVMAAAGGNVHFPGAIYEQEKVRALRFHAVAYCHGHTVGGTNPSLVEALGAGNAVIAHDNEFNRWVAGEDQFYFRSVEDCDRLFTRIENEPETVERARQSARRRFEREFVWQDILGKYETLCRPYTGPAAAISRDVSVSADLGK